MKYTNFKTLGVMLSASVMLALSGCDSNGGIPSTTQLVGSVPVTPPVTPPVVPPVTPPVVPPTCLEAEGYESITLNNGQIWLDRNVGASEVAADVNDTAAFGDYYQWGRSTEGHQVSTSDTNETKADIIVESPGSDWDGKFITLGQNSSHFDWTISSLDSNGSERQTGWGTADSETQVCPCGFVVATVADYETLIEVTADVEALKFTYAGYRDGPDGSLIEDTSAWLWTRDASGVNSVSVELMIDNNSSDSSFTAGDYRNYGQPVRCIDPATSVATDVPIDNGPE